MEAVLCVAVGLCILSRAFFFVLQLMQLISPRCVVAVLCSYQVAFWHACEVLYTELDSVLQVAGLTSGIYAVFASLVLQIRQLYLLVYGISHEEALHLQRVTLHLYCEAMQELAAPLKQ